MLCYSQFRSLSAPANHISAVWKLMRPSGYRQYYKRKQAQTVWPRRRGSCCVDSFDGAVFIAARMSSDDTSVGSYQKPSDEASPRSSSSSHTTAGRCERLSRIGRSARILENTEDDDITCLSCFGADLGFACAYERVVQDLDSGLEWLYISIMY